MSQSIESLIKDKCKIIAEHYGAHPQMKMMIEECAELTQAICKLFRSSSLESAKEAKSHYIEELADVVIVSQQLVLLLPESQRTQFVNTLRFKLKRQLDRIEKEKT